MSSSPSFWRSPIAKQSFATLGVSLGMMSVSQVTSFSSILLPQMRRTMNINDEEASWIGSIAGISFFVAIFLMPVVMDKYGRRTANLIRCILLATSWFSLFITTSLYGVLFIRFLQGLCIGIAAILVPVLIGEYTSPKYRGSFLTTITLSLAMGVLSIHLLGAFFSWQTVAIVCAVLTVGNTIIVSLSPESPSYLAARGKNEECIQAFRWLRGEDEKEELEKLIRSSSVQKSHQTIEGPKRMFLHKRIVKFWQVLKKKEFYKPIILIFHLHIINEWSGASAFDAYTPDIFHRVVGNDIDVSLMIISTDILRAVSGTCAIIVIRRVRRRLMLLITTTLNIVSFFIISGYVFAKTHDLLPYDNVYIGVSLIHFYVFTFSIGNLVLPNILAGEIFPLKHRSTCSMIAQIFFCVNYTVYLKTAFRMFSSIGLHGTYIVSATLVAYGLTVSWLMLPETKDKTLQAIEEEFRGEPLYSETNTEELLPVLQKKI